jgi:hypothetical protein
MLSKKFEKAIEQLTDAAKKDDMAYVFAALTPEGESSYVMMNCNGEDVAFFAAEILFDFCKRVSEADGIPASELLDLTMKEVSNYIEVMKRADTMVQSISDDIKGDLN